MIQALRLYACLEARGHPPSSFCPLPLFDEKAEYVVVFSLKILCVALYGAASCLGVFGLKRERHGVAVAAKVVFCAAVLLHSAAIGLESVSTSGTLLSGPNIVMLASWVLAVVTMAGMLATKRGMAFAALAAPLVALLVLVSQWMRMLDSGAADNLAYYSWPFLVVHVVLVFVALACFATSAVSGGLDLYQRRLMRVRSAQVLSLDTPAIDTLGRISRYAGLAGLAVFAVALLIGVTHLVARYAVLVQVGYEGSLVYLVPRMALSLVTAAIWSLFCSLSFLAPWACSARAKDAIALMGLAAMVLLVAVSAG